MAARILCLLLLAGSGVLAKPSDAGEPPAPSLDITGSHKLGHPIFGDQIGLLPPGITFELTCSTKDGGVTLSWWEDGKRLESKEVKVEDQGTGRSIALETLSVSDDGRKFTCKADEANVEKTIFLQVEQPEKEEIQATETLDIIVNEKTLNKNEISIEMKSGSSLKLTCVLQGYEVSSTSWFEDDMKLESEFSRSTYASSNVLTLPVVTTADTGRRLSCRSDDAEQDRTVQLQVFHTESYGTTEDQIGTIKIVLISVIVVGVLTIVVMVVVVARLVKQYKEAVRCDKVSKVSELFRNYTLLPNANGSSKDSNVGQLARGPYKPCTVLIDPDCYE